MSYTNTMQRHGLGLDKEALKVAKEEAKQRAINAAKAQVIAKTKGKVDGLSTKRGGTIVYNPQPSRYPDVLSDDEARALYDEQWALAAGKPVPAAPAGGEGGAPAAEGPPTALIAGGLLAAAAGIWYWKKRRG